jgi:hypothetical protein
MAQGKHHPLQWNMGTTCKKTACCGMDHDTTLPSEFRYAPRWFDTTP